MNLLITGGAGFIGSHLAERLIADGRSVTVLDDLSTGSVDNLASIYRHPRFSFVEGSVRNRDLIARLVQTCDVVVHLAAAVGVRYILDQPLGSIKTNVYGTDAVLEAAARLARKTLVASTSEVYGKNESAVLCETADSVIGPTSISRWSYATGKKLDEFLALAYAHDYGLPVIVTRFFNIVGPRQAGRYGMVLPNFVRAALAGAPIPVFGDGWQTRNFTFIADCVDAIIRLIECPSAVGEIFNIGGLQEVAILELAQRVRRLSGSSSPILHVPYEQAYPEGSYEDMRRRVPCICKIQRYTGWAPTTSIDEMILATIRHYQRRGESVPALTVAMTGEAPPSSAAARAAARPVAGRVKARIPGPCSAETPKNGPPPATASSPSGG